MCVYVNVCVFECRWISAKDTTKAATDSCSRFNFGFSMEVDQAEVDCRLVQPSTHLHTVTRTYTPTHTHDAYV